ncbi:hypothetical protein [Saccharicrinis sp. GN24d3]|uniref:hypothetical protein n=1 Tax=Saccharicrinis sp. GN24d3 TaxID=3458416 RepID=UPI004036848D
MHRIKAKVRHCLRTIPIIHILSDSHGEAFKYIDWGNFNITPSYCIVQGATASGLANPNSKTKALPIFTNYLKTRVKKNDTIIFQLGEIDCGFTIWLRAEKKGLNINKQLEETLKNYTRLLKFASYKTQNKVIVTSAIPPTIEDDQDFGEIANLRKEVKANLVERTNLTKSFNLKINEICIQESFTFIDLDRTLIDTDKLVVKQEYKNNNHLDHHLEPTKLAQLLESELSKIL